LGLDTTPTDSDERKKEREKQKERLGTTCNGNKRGGGAFESGRTRVIPEKGGRESGHRSKKGEKLTSCSKSRRTELGI